MLNVPTVVPLAWFSAVLLADRVRLVGAVFDDESAFHSSAPVVPSLARKYSVPFTLVRFTGSLLPPLRMSWT
ncbi:MAG: hypothetical protein ACK5EA_08625, partial [Planctomycetaceae bacterium]